MNRTELIKQAIESAKCRIYKLNFDTNKELSAHHQRKAENQKELMEITVEALEKQIPKKPYYVVDGYADGELVYDSAECPNCGHLFEYDINDWESNYCLDCGQRLDWTTDWSEEND